MHGVVRLGQLHEELTTREDRLQSAQVPASAVVVAGGLPPLRSEVEQMATDEGEASQYTDRGAEEM